MALSADFTVSERVGDGVLSVSFTDTSIGTPTYWKWILGDGNVIEGASHSTIGYTYRTPGIYSPILIVNDGVDQSTIQKTDYIIVNVSYPRPEFVIMQSFSVTLNNYWRLYFDYQGYLNFENKDYIYRSRDPVMSVHKWQYVEFHSADLKMIFSGSDTYLKELGYITIENTNPLPITQTRTEIAPNSTLKLDELKIWARDADFTSYFLSTRGQAYKLDH